MAVRNCVVCGVEFEGRSNQLSCSPQCQRENHARYMRERYKRQPQDPNAYLGRIWREALNRPEIKYLKKLSDERKRLRENNQNRH